MAQSRLTSVDDVIIDTAADVALRAKDKVSTAITIVAGVEGRQSRPVPDNL